MVETPLRGHPQSVGGDAVTLCIILALFIAFVPWSKAFAMDMQIAAVTVEEFAPAPSGTSTKSGPVYETPRGIRYDSVPYDSSTKKYARSYHRKPAHPHAFIDDVARRLEGTRLQVVADRVVDMEHGTALRMWQVSDQWSVNAYDPRHGDVGVKLSFQR